MTLPAPPLQPPGTPVEVRLLRATTLIRVHTPSHRADAFNPTAQPTAARGGRFDSTDGSYAYTYLGDGAGAAIAETLMRDMPLDGQDRRLRSCDLVDPDRHLARVQVVRPLVVVDLCGPALNHLGAPLELTKCEAGQYGTTRLWAEAIRFWCPTAAGFVYRPRHDENTRAYVLFDDGPDAPHPRARGALVAMNDPGVRLASVQGLRVVRRIARAHHVSIDTESLPASPRSSALP